MSKIEIGRYSERLRRSLGMKGQETVASELSPEVSPVIIIEDNDAQWQFLQGVRLCSSAMLQGTVVAQNNIFRLRNPAGSGVVGEVNVLSMSGNIAGMVFNLGYGVTQAELGTAGTTGLRDSRWGTGIDNTTLIASRANNVALNFASSIWITRAFPDHQWVYPHGRFIILPGESIEWGTASVNLTLVTTVDWTERQLPALEA